MTDIRSVLVLKGKSTYNSTFRFLGEMQREWAAEGMETEELNVYNEVLLHKQIKKLSAGKKVDLVFSFNGMMLEHPEFIEFLHRQRPIYCTMLMDHPLHHHARLTADVDRMFVLAVDYYHVQFLNDYYPNIMAEAFLPHAGCAAKKIIPYRERQILISFVGSYSDPEQKKACFKRKDQTEEMLIRLTAQTLEKNTDVPIEDAFAAVLTACKVKISRADFARQLTFMKPADAYVRAANRKRVIQTLLDAHLSVDVYGNGWEKFEGTNREYLRIHPALDFKKSLEVTANSKFSLNVMPGFKAGSHDRVFTAMGCGALALSDTSRYWEELAAHGKKLSQCNSSCENALCTSSGMLLYRLDELEQLPELVNYYISHEAEAEELSVRGQANFNRAHTWAHRAQQIKEEEI